jgi:hypothetical protein
MIINFKEPVFYLADDDLVYSVDIVAFNFQQEEVTGNLEIQFLIRFLEGEFKGETICIYLMWPEDISNFRLANEQYFRFRKNTFYKEEE